jgi:tetratricopeptide (TPR) repeat protein
MTPRTLWLALVLGASVAAVAPPVAMALGDTTGAPCAVTAGSGTASNNTITCNFGLTPEQLRQVSKAAVEDATAPLIDRIASISKTLGVTEEAAKTLLRIIGEQPDVPDERLGEVLTKVATDYKRLQTQVAALNPDNPTARDLVERAKSEIAAGHFAAAHQLLLQARKAQIAAAQEAAKLAEQAQAARDAQLLGAAASAAAEGDLTMTELHYAQAADLFKQAAGLVPAGHPEETTNYSQRQADALYRQGDERGDNAALKQSIDTWRLVLQQRPRARVPLDWAAMQNNLGRVLKTLGERESGTAQLEEAVATYRAALEERTHDRVPLDWAMTQMNLGNALQVLGERESGTERLEEAVAAYRAALEEWTRAGVPLRWAVTQNNLGNALARLGERESGTARLEQAVAAFRAALEERTHDRVPLDWAMTQMNLGNALQSLGERESGTARLEEAVAAHRAALEEYTRDHVPLSQAYSDHGLANGLAALAIREKSAPRMEEALTCMRAAVEIYRQSGETYWLQKATVRVTEMEAELGNLQKRTPPLGRH